MEGQDTFRETQSSLASPIYTSPLIGPRAFGLAKKDLINIRVLV